MQIKSTDILAGQPIIKIRDFLHRVSGIVWTIDHLMSFFEINRSKAKSIIDCLEQGGYIETHLSNSRENCWINTLNGNSLALASAAKPIKRDAANRKVQEFLARVKDANSSGIFCYKVTKVLVFGSYLSAKERIGDIDLAVKLVPVKSDPKEQQILEQKKISEAIEKGRNFRNYLEELFWPREELYRFLKSRSRSISIHSVDDQILQQVEYKVLYDEISPE